MTALRRRIRKFEALMPAPRPAFTKEEIYVARLALVSAIARRRPPIAEQQRAQQIERKLSLKVVSTVRRQNTDQFREHMTDYVIPMWKIRTGSSSFLAPVAGSEYDDWELPSLYLRRCAIRHCPTIVRLLGPPDLAKVPVSNHVIEWNLIYKNLIFAAARGQDRPNAAMLE